VHCTIFAAFTGQVENGLEFSLFSKIEYTAYGSEYEYESYHEHLDTLDPRESKEYDTIYGNQTAFLKKNTTHLFTGTAK